MKTIHFTSELLRQEFITYAAVTIDLIWMKRNELLHNPNLVITFCMIQDLSKSIEKTAQSHWNCQLSKITMAGKINSLSWKAAPLHWLKINTDSTFKDGVAQVAFVIRNHNGSILHAFSKEFLCIDPGYL